MDGQYLVSSPIKSNIQAINKPTQFSPGADKTTRTVEMDKGFVQPMNTRETTPSITLGGM
jgi:mannitol/fructose-specific phosphotransferase system IIA component